MMAAIGAAKAGHHAIIYEKNEKLGKKLYITGKGRCNLTNNSSMENHLSNVKRNPKFLYRAFHAFDSTAVMDFLESEGLRLKTERGGRVFPESDKSSDVIRTLQGALGKEGVAVRLQTPVKRLLTEGGRCRGVVLAEGRREKEKRADAVIVATGGVSYPSTGSTGDGYRFAIDAGHSLVPVTPSLVPFEVGEGYIRQMQGLSLRNVVLTLYGGKEKLFEEMGELLFTHFGISGPLVLSASSIVSGTALCLPAPDGGRHKSCPVDCRGMINLKPGLSEKQLDERIQRDFREYPNVFFKNSLNRLLPAKMIPVIVALSGICPEQKVNEITKHERQQLAGLIREFPFTVTALRGFQEAVITRGGIPVKEVNPATMESKKTAGLYFAGEVLDLDAKTGGYNLQIAWSTGYLAGSSIP